MPSRRRRMPTVVDQLAALLEMTTGICDNLESLEKEVTDMHTQVCVAAAQANTLAAEASLRAALLADANALPRFGKKLSNS